MGIASPGARWRLNPFIGQAPPLPVPKPDPDVLAFHRSLRTYRPTPLYSLPSLAESLGVGALLVKDEGERFGLKAFKGLGASYAMYRFLKKAWEERLGEPFDMAHFLSLDVSARLGAITFCTATDGNHGRAVAWTARQLRQKAVIYVPGNTVPARIEALRGEGARVVVVDGTYDDTVRRAAADAAREGWQVISDTAYPGYMEIPGWIMAGYSTIFAETDEQIATQGLSMPDVVLLQAGVGGLACGAVMYYKNAHGGGRKPKLAAVEPTDADCLLESIDSPDGSPREAKGRQNSIMAGLNCGTPSLLAWPWLRSEMAFFLAVDDEFAAEAMRRLYHPRGGDPRVVSGESGAAGLAGLLALGAPGMRAAREALGLCASSRVLLVNSEADTDPENFKRIVERRS